MKDVMLDFETFGSGPNACVVQVGACFFDRETGKIGQTFKRNIQAEIGELNPDTIYWWLQQSGDARDSILAEPRESASSVFRDLNYFLSGAQYVWSHATFDFVILKNTLKVLGLRPAVSYKTCLDIRTLMALADLDKDLFERKGTHHDALHDCKFQIEYCMAALNKLRNAFKYAEVQETFNFTTFLP